MSTDIPSDEEIPPPRDVPMTDIRMRIGLSPEEFNAAQFQVDLANLLSALDSTGTQMPPDNIEIVSVTPVRNPSIRYLADQPYVEPGDAMDPDDASDNVVVANHSDEPTEAELNDPYVDIDDLFQRYGKGNTHVAL